jgi:hypothetical protein
VQVGMAHAAGLDPDQRLVRAWVGNDHGGELDGLALDETDDCLHFMGHS